MTTTLSQLRAMGYQIEAEGEDVAYRWTGPGDPPEEARTLLAELARHKTEALAALRQEADRLPVDPDGPLPPWPFAVRSRILDGTEVWITPDGWPDPVPGPAYTHAEVRALQHGGVTPEGLRAVHRVKLAVDGEVIR